ncbi:MAG TPA: glycosyltransferase family 2 protein [Gemmatimonadaceae bacterium]|jgi:glycosyltransferase involved in cell wall biosynthesis|nr:glycosyltransferase family 2 protein [Gemmatimonadaceae bacterium]
MTLHTPAAVRPIRYTPTRPVEREIELSVVMPCLNEADTLATCIEKAKRALAEHGIVGEIVVADNGSTDGSQEIAARHGARVVPVADRGYGAALMGGIAAARGRFIIMGDADDSYDFGEIPRFVAKLREGYELVQGCRLPTGGGAVAKGAMPVLHRWWGNPMFSAMARLWFRAPIHDIHCGMRGFTRDLAVRLKQRCSGMEFASEMIIKATFIGARISEVPITLYPDGRVAHPPHLKTFRDGWRHLRFMLLYSPRWLFLIPGALLILAGLGAYALGMPGTRIGGVGFDVHTVLVGSLAILCGYQAILFAIFAKIFAIAEGLLPADTRIARLSRYIQLEHGVAGGAIALAAGLILIGMAVKSWWGVSFGPLDYSRTMRVVIPGVTMSAIGFQTILSSFFMSVLAMKRE